MFKTKDLVMLAALATVLALGTACFGLFTRSSEPAEESAVPECAGLSGQARIDCEARHSKP